MAHDKKTKLQVAPSLDSSRDSRTTNRIVSLETSEDDVCVTSSEVFRRFALWLLDQR